MLKAQQLIFIALIVLWGCQGAPKEADTALPQAEIQKPADIAPADVAPPATARFSEELEKKDCELLTGAMVSKVSGVAEADLKATTPGGWCQYEGGGVTATIMFVDVGKDAQKKAGRFNSAYKNRPGAEVAKAMELVKAQADKRVAEGKLDEKTAKQAKGLGDAVSKGPLASGFKYEEIDGPWDKGMFDKSEQKMNIGGHKIHTYTNKMHVLVSNMDFSVEYQTDEAASHKDRVVQLAKEIAGNLPK